MPTRSERSKKKKSRRRPGKTSKKVFARGKTGKRKCAVCKKVLHGTPHGKKASEVRKLSKTKKRPTGLFAGILCGKCRNLVAEEAAKVSSGSKKIGEVELRLKKYVEQVKVE